MRAVTSVGVVAVLACAGDPVAPDGLTALQQVAATEFGLVEVATRQAWTGPGVLPFIGPANVDLGLLYLCAADTTGAEPRNARGIPARLTLAFPVGRCNRPSSFGGGGRLLEGTIRIEDLGGSYAARVTYDRMVSISSTGVSRTEVRADGYVEVRELDDSTADVLRQLNETQEVSRANGTIRTTRGGTIRTTVRVPPGRVGRGDITVPGAHTYAGTRFVVIQGARRDSIHLEFTTVEPLTTSSACLQGPLSGIVELRYACNP